MALADVVVVFVGVVVAVKLTVVDVVEVVIALVIVKLFVARVGFVALNQVSVEFVVAVVTQAVIEIVTEIGS